MALMVDNNGNPIGNTGIFVGGNMGNVHRWVSTEDDPLITNSNGVIVQDEGSTLYGKHIIAGGMYHDTDLYVYIIPQSEFAVIAKYGTNQVMTNRSYVGFEVFYID